MASSRRLDLRAERQSARYAEICLQARLHGGADAHAAALLRLEETTVLAGDYNIIPSRALMTQPPGRATLFLPQSRAAYRRLSISAYGRAARRDGRAGLYTFWDYQAGAWQKNRGIRIDHLLLSPQAADRLKRVEIAKAMRAGEKPSDHAPSCADLA